MQSQSRTFYALPSIGTLIAEQAKKVLIHPLFKVCVLVLIAMLVMVTIALSLGLWWDSLWSAG
jgi:hypothetical protein